MSRWFRHYAGMMRDDKLVRVSIKSGQSVERVCWVWSAILESAAEIDDEGRYEVDAAEISRFLRCKASAITSIVDALTTLDRLDGDKVAKWQTRQYKSDRSAARVALHRDRKRNGGNGDETLHVTLQERHCNAPETENRDRDSSEAKASASIDPEKVIFNAGIGLLMAAGKREDQARTLLGKWRRDHGGAAVIEALGAAQREGAINPVAFIEGRWRHRQREASDAPLC